MRFMISIRNIEEKGQREDSEWEQIIEEASKIGKNMKEMRGASSS